jgi:ATP-dependent exoDNAse (exonuclease V) alpha subunit
LTVVVGGRQVRLDARYLDPTAGRPLGYGYAITGHVAQGMTASRAYVLGSEAAYREWGYVAMSRGRQLNRFYVVGRGSLERDEFAPAERSADPLDAHRAPRGARALACDLKANESPLARGGSSAA